MTTAGDSLRQLRRDLPITARNYQPALSRGTRQALQTSFPRLVVDVNVGSTGRAQRLRLETKF